jgi:hypothetical protein
LTVRVSRVSTLSTVTLAAGTADPLLSVTDPRITPKTIWAEAACANTSTSATTHIAAMASLDGAYQLRVVTFLSIVAPFVELCRRKGRL